MAARRGARDAGLRRLPVGDARAVLGRIWSVLVFLVAVTVVAELADAAGLFEAAADVATRAGRGSVLALWLLGVALATLTTVLLSLDTTAVLLTPVVLALAQRGWPCHRCRSRWRRRGSRTPRRCCCRCRT